MKLKTSLVLGIIICSFGLAGISAAAPFLPAVGGTGATTTPSKGSTLFGSAGSVYGNFAPCSDGQVMIASSTAPLGVACSAMGGGGSGTVSTSSPASAGYFPFWASPTQLAGTSSAFQYLNRFGIGTTTPTERLTVVSQSTTSPNGIGIVRGIAGQDTGIIFRNEVGDVRNYFTWDGGVEDLRFYDATRAAGLIFKSGLDNNSNFAKISTYATSSPPTLEIIPGDATTGVSGGDVVIGGGASDSGVGVIKLRPGGQGDSSKDVSLILSDITTVRDITVPDEAGTLALGTGVGGECAQWSSANTIGASGAPCGGSSVGPGTSTQLAFFDSESTITSTSSISYDPALDTQGVIFDGVRDGLRVSSIVGGIHVDGNADLSQSFAIYSDNVINSDIYGSASSSVDVVIASGSVNTTTTPETGEYATGSEFSLEGGRAGDGEEDGPGGGNVSINGGSVYVSDSELVLEGEVNTGGVSIASGEAEDDNGNQVSSGYIEIEPGTLPNSNNLGVGPSINLAPGLAYASSGVAYFGNVTIRDQFNGGNSFAFDVASSTLFVGQSGLPGCVAIMDSDGAGFTYLTTLGGTLSTTSTKPAFCADYPSD